MDRGKLICESVLRSMITCNSHAGPRVDMLAVRRVERTYLRILRIKLCELRDLLWGVHIHDGLWTLIRCRIYTVIE